MTDKAQRKQLTAEYRQKPAEAGVYRIHNTAAGRSLVGTSTNLTGIRNRVEFGKSTKSTAGFDYRMHADIRLHGFDALTFEVLEALEVKPEATSAQIQRDLETLEKLWSEQLGPDSLY